VPAWPRACRCQGEKKTQESQLLSPLRPRAWHHLVVCHSAGGGLTMAAASARVYVNGVLEANLKLRYPSKVDAMSALAIASACVARLVSACRPLLGEPQLMASLDNHCACEV
jgi:hypothetical protein